MSKIITRIAKNLTEANENELEIITDEYGIERVGFVKRAAEKIAAAWRGRTEIRKKFEGVEIALRFGADEIAERYLPKQYGEKFGKERAQQAVTLLCATIRQASVGGGHIFEFYFPDEMEIHARQFQLGK